MSSTDPLPVFNHGKHKEWEAVSVHTAKCDRCHGHNTTVIQRCKRCNQQFCRTCIAVCGNDNLHEADPDKLDWNPAPFSAAESAKRPKKPKNPRVKKTTLNKSDPITSAGNPSKVGKRETPQRKSGKISTQVQTPRQVYYEKAREQMQAYDNESIYIEDSADESYQPSRQNSGSTKKRNPPQKEPSMNTSSTKAYAPEAEYTIESPERVRRMNALFRAQREAPAPMTNSGGKAYSPEADNELEYLGTAPRINTILRAQKEVSKNNSSSKGYAPEAAYEFKSPELPQRLTTMARGQREASMANSGGSVYPRGGYKNGVQLAHLEQYSIASNRTEAGNELLMTDPQFHQYDRDGAMGDNGYIYRRINEPTRIPPRDYTAESGYNYSQTPRPGRIASRYLPNRAIASRPESSGSQPGRVLSGPPRGYQMSSPEFPAAALTHQPDRQFTTYEAHNVGPALSRGEGQRAGSEYQAFYSESPHGTEHQGSRGEYQSPNGDRSEQAGQLSDREARLHYLQTTYGHISEFGRLCEEGKLEEAEELMDAAQLLREMHEK
ncbi:hypothetical protein EG329_001699 [Mollisiaceae sp. DMI_Dod_QoI]|nr:hypothetical protein EG329_001699 [Helotiales sp. DMI_Dod_QoI]